jgi:hypothetical protein
MIVAPALVVPDRVVSPVALPLPTVLVAGADHIEPTGQEGR